MLTAKGEEVDRIVGFELGADDYIAKPFSPREVGLRVRAVLRRTAARSNEPSNHIDVHGLTINLYKHQVHSSAGEIDLTATEFKILTLFAPKVRTLWRADRNSPRRGIQVFGVRRGMSSDT